MNYHYPKSKRQWQEKIERKNKLRELQNFKEKSYDRDKFDCLYNIIINNINAINDMGFEQDKTLSSSTKNIKFVSFCHNEDEIKSVPFDLIFDSDRNLSLYWKDDEDLLMKEILNREQFIELVKKYVRFYYAIKILDTNMDNVREKIRKIYPGFNKLICDYKYNSNKNYNVDKKLEDLKFYMYKFDDGKVYLGVTGGSLEKVHEFDKEISDEEEVLDKYFKSDNYEGPIFLKCVRMYFDDDTKFCEIVKEIKKEYNITNDQLINSKQRQPRYYS